MSQVKKLIDYIDGDATHPPLGPDGIAREVKKLFKDAPSKRKIVIAEELVSALLPPQRSWSLASERMLRTVTIALAEEAMEEDKSLPESKKIAIGINRSIVECVVQHEYTEHTAAAAAAVMIAVVRAAPQEQKAKVAGSAFFDMLFLVTDDERAAKIASTTFEALKLEVRDEKYEDPRKVLEVAIFKAKDATRYACCAHLSNTLDEMLKQALAEIEDAAASSAPAASAPPTARPAKTASNPTMLGHIAHGDNTCWTAAFLNALVGMPYLDEFLRVSDEEKELILSYNAQLRELETLIADTQRRTLPDDAYVKEAYERVKKVYERLMSELLERGQICLPPSLILPVPPPTSLDHIKDIIQRLLRYQDLKNRVREIIQDLEKGESISKSRINFIARVLGDLNIRAYGDGSTDDAQYALNLFLQTFYPPSTRIPYPVRLRTTVELSEKTQVQTIPPEPTPMTVIAYNLEIRSMHGMLFKDCYHYNSDSMLTVEKFASDSELPPIIAMKAVDVALQGDGEWVEHPHQKFCELPFAEYIDGAVLLKGYSSDRTPSQPYRLAKIVAHVGFHWITYFYHNQK